MYKYSGTQRRIVGAMVKMMTGLSFAVVSFTLFVATGATGARDGAQAIAMRAVVTLSDSAGGVAIPVEDRRLTVPLDNRFQIFLANFSVTIEARKIDSAHCRLVTGLSTVGSRPWSKSASFDVELGVPATITEIAGKEGRTFRLKMWPEKFVALDTPLCEYHPFDSTSFRFDPSANFDLYYTPGSLGDAHWNIVKTLLEDEYRRFVADFDITITGKQYVYLFPCASPAVGWDTRYGYGIDPARQAIFTVYRRGFVSVSPIIVNLNKILRAWGYAPPFLAEGISAYYMFPDYECLNAQNSNTLLSLDSLVTTASYYRANAKLASAEAGSFCRYLADTKGLTLFLKLYELSDDMTIRDAFVRVYGKPLAELEADWRVYLSALKPRRELYEKRALLEGALSDVTGKRDILETLLQRDTVVTDSLRTLQLLSGVYSELGQYDRAFWAFHFLRERIDPKVALYATVLQREADVTFLLGDYRNSESCWRTLAKKDTLYTSIADYGEGRVALAEGDTVRAIMLLERGLKSNQDLQTEAELSLRLGFIRRSPGKFADASLAATHFSDAKNAATILSQKEPNGSLHRYRLGLSMIGLGEFDAAGPNLEMALFLEFRAQFQGRMLIALGQLADLRKKRADAKDYYLHAMEADPSLITKIEAEHYLASPFKMAKL